MNYSMTMTMAELYWIYYYWFVFVSTGFNTGHIACSSLNRSECEVSWRGRGFGAACLGRATRGEAEGTSSLTSGTEEWCFSCSQHQQQWQCG